MEKLTTKQARFVEEYFVDFNGTQAAIRAGYSEHTASVISSENLIKPNIQRAIAEKMKSLTMTSEEAMTRMTAFARGSFSPFMEYKENGDVKLNLHSDQAKANINLIRKIKHTERRYGPPDDPIFDVTTEIELHDAKDAVKTVLQLHDKLNTVTIKNRIEGLSEEQLNSVIDSVIQAAKPKN